MPIEIRELIIKTEVKTTQRESLSNASKLQIERLKKEVLENCKRMILESNKKKVYNR